MNATVFTHTKEKMLEEFYDVVPRRGAGPGAAGPALLARTCRSIRGGHKEPCLNVQNRTVGHTGRAVNGGVNRLEGKDVAAKRENKETLVVVLVVVFSTDGFSGILGGNVLASNKPFLNDGFPKEKTEEWPPSTQTWVLSGRVHSSEAETDSRFPAAVIPSVFNGTLQLQQAGGHQWVINITVDGIFVFLVSYLLT